MKASKMIIPTLKEAPSEAIIPSHILMLRAGLIRKLVSGVYNFLPMGVRTLRKIENIIREEMDNSGALEILSSAIQPKELWELSGRWQKYGPELIRFTDRHEHEYCLGPTHEEIFTDLIKNIVKSYKSLPINVYQIQTKYRDEIRPRFGLMRGREFIMKDSYSFDLDEKGLDTSYQLMYDTYSKIFTRLGINYKVVLADTGSIGGNGSHQFMALSNVGESQIIYCDECHYAADEEKATSNCIKLNKESLLDIEEVLTPNAHTIEEVSSYLNIDSRKVVKTMIYYASDNDTFGAFLVRGDCEINEIKVATLLNSSEVFIRMATDEEIEKIGSKVGFIGPIGLKTTIFVDKEVTEMTNFVVGANKENYHLINVNFNKDFTGEVVDIKKSKEGDLCPICGKPLKTERGIEVGQIFKLQTKYSTPMGCVYLNEQGKTMPMVMGCYGIGVTRTFASIVEQHHDENGIVFPIQVAPYHIAVIAVNYDDEEQKRVSDLIHDQLTDKHIEVVEDDRKLKLGFKLKDWELIGIPYLIIAGRRSNENIVEFKDRINNTKEEISIEEAISRITEIVKDIK